jgi:hypothetical protein
LEFTAGKMGDHLVSKGIVIQRTVPYAHEQNGKSERYIRTLEEGGQALLAGSGLPMTFWLDAVLTRQYLCNRLPTSTLPNDVTPFESITNGRKPDLSHLRVWGCDCYVAIPSELRPKAGFKRFQAIFVGYEDHRIGWRVRDLKGKYSFSNDVIFNENLSGRLGIPRSPSSPVLDDLPQASSPRLRRVGSRTRTIAGQAYDDILRLKEFRRVERERKRLKSSNGAANGGAADVGVVDVGVHGDVAENVAALGDVAEVVGCHKDGGVSGEFISYLVSSSFPDQVETDSMETLEPDIIANHCLSALVPSAQSIQRSSSSFDLSKVPFSYSDAIARPDASIWRSAMARERLSLHEMGAFEEVDLPAGERTIGLTAVF